MGIWGCTDVDSHCSEGEIANPDSKDTNGYTDDPESDADSGI